jgi:hypothetical protein
MPAILSVAPISRRASLMLTDDPHIIGQAKRIEESAAAVWSNMRNMFEQAAGIMTQPQFVHVFGTWMEAGQRLQLQQQQIDSATAELRSYCLERFSKLEE